MKLDVRRNAKRNLAWGALLRIYQILVPLVIRQAFIFSLGVEYAGLGGLFTAVLSVLNLAEMGVASAIVFFMYKPVANDDDETICRLLGLFRRWYRRIGLFVLVLGLIITPFIGYLISGDSPEGINIYAIFLLTLFSSLVTYWPFAYKSALLTVFQRDDLASRIRLGALTFKYAFQLIVLLWFGNYYAFLVVEIVAKLLERFITVLVVDKRYPALNHVLEPTPTMSEGLRKKTRALILHQIGGVIVNSADAIVISLFLGLVVLGKYQNYVLVMTAVLGFVLLINRATQAGIGNRLSVVDMEERRRLFDNYSFLVFAVSMVCCCCFLNLYQPFIVLWLGEDMLLPEGIVVTLCAYFFVLLLMMPGNHFESAGGLWEYDRFRPLLEGLLNLVMNLIAVQFMGLYGVLLSTIVSMLLFSIPWLYYNVAKNLLGGGFGSCMRRIVLRLAACAVTCALSWALCGLLPDMPLFAGLIVKCFISVLVPTFLLFVLFRKSSEWSWAWCMLRSLFHKAEES